MTREDIIKLAREAGFTEGDLAVFPDLIVHFAALVTAEKEKQIIAANAPEIEKINAHIKELEEALVIGREKVAQWMTQQGYATGHGDSIEDLLKELEWQIRESEREACAKVVEAIERNGAWVTKAEAAAAIRART